MRESWNPGVIAAGLFALLFLTSSPEGVGAQVSEEWARRYAGQTFAEDYATAAAVDEAGNLYVTGATECCRGYAYLTVKYASDGTELWARRYRGPAGSGSAAAIAVDQSGNVYVTGGSEEDFATVKYASDGTELWVRRYDGPGRGSDAAVAIAVDPAGNVFVTGKSMGTLGYDYATVKYSSDGTELWVRRYDGQSSSTDEPHALAVDQAGNVVVTGGSWGGTWIYATVKYASDGTELWVRTYTGPAGSDAAFAVAVDPAGDVYVTGNSDGGTTRWDYATIKYSSDGTELWVRRYNDPANRDNLGAALAVDASGNLLVTGDNRTAALGFWTVKYSSDGTELWQRTYSAGALVSAVAVDPAGGVYVVGTSIGLGNTYDYTTVKYTSDGTEAWVRCYDGPANGWDSTGALVVDKTGDIYVTGRSDGGLSGPDFATLKYSSDGNELWVQRHGEIRDSKDFARALAVDQAGNVYVTGYSEVPGMHIGYLDDYLTIKYSGGGAELWARTYNGPGDARDYAYALGVDPAGNVFVTGESYGSGGNRDFATIKYSSDGNELWVRRYDNPTGGNDFATALAVDPAGDVIVTGHSDDPTSNYSTTVKYASDGAELWVRTSPGNLVAVAVDPAGNVFVTGFATIKFASDGTELWQRPYGGFAVTADQAGDVYVTGEGEGSGPSDPSDYATVKYSSDGTEMWVRTYDGPGDSDDRALALAVDPAGNLYVTGRSRGLATTYDDYATIKYSSDGTELWARRYDGGNGDDWASAIAVDATGNAYVTGFSGGAGFDYATVKYTSDGTEAWVERYDGTRTNNHDLATGVAVDPAGNVFVTGNSYDTVSGPDCATIKYSQKAGRALLRNTEVTTLDPLPALSTILPLDPVADLYISPFPSGNVDPDSGILNDSFHPLVFYGLDGPEKIHLAKTAAEEILITY